MKAIDKTAAKEWCEAHDFEIDSGGLPSLIPTTEKFSIPEDAGARVALVRGHMRAFCDEEETCVWLNDWSVWPSGQWEHLFQQFRLSYGISEKLAELPCQLIQKKEFDATVSTVIYAVLMLWDCYVLGASGQRFVFYSHDEVGLKSA
ncbi:MAG: hypothetical protein AAGJ81_08055 [Verrucomicrobiota bacterium]